MKTNGNMRPLRKNTPLESERGVILILAMLVVLVLACVVVQLFFTTTVNREITEHQKIAYPMAMAARGALLQAQAVLIQDLQNQAADAGTGDEGGDTGTGGDTGGDTGDEPGGGPGIDGGDGGGEEPAGESGANSDSLVDEWARPGAIAVMTSNELDVKVVIRDEDSKFNILSIVAKDEEYAEECRDRLARLIDTFREDTRADVSMSTADRLVDSMVKWFEGNRDTDRFPKPKIKTGPKDEEPETLDRDEINFPLSIEELQMCEGMTPEILFGFQEKGERIPGLIEFITCHSNLIFDEIPTDEEEIEDDPYGNETGGEEEEDPPPGGETGDEEEEPEVAIETNNGRININTAPLPVLRALMDDSEITNSVLERIIEFRDKAIEAYEKSLERDWELDNPDDEDEDEDFIFTDPAEVIERVEDYFETSFNLEKDAEEKFASLLTVTSNVFTIYVSVRKTEANLCQNFRAVIWRRSGGAASTGVETGEETTDSEQTSEPHFITLVPLEPYPYPLPTSEKEEEEMERDYY